MSSGEEQPMQDSSKSGQCAPGSQANRADDSDYTLVIRFKERPLIWIAIGVLAILVVIEGAAILSMRSSSSSYTPPPPSEFEDFDGASGGGGQSFQQQNGSSSYGGKQPETFNSSQPTTSTRGGSAGGAVEIVTGDQAVTVVKAFVEDAGLDKRDADELLAAIEETNASIAALDASLAKGELELGDYQSSIHSENERARLAILRVLGWQKSTVLLEQLSVSAAP